MRSERMREKILDWLRLGRAQTYPADWLLVLTPFLHGGVKLGQAIVLSVFMWLVHLVSFGENSLFDFTQGYDKSDPGKSHHPLETGRISVHAAMNVIVWGKNVLMVIGCLLTFLWSPAPSWSIFGLFMWYAWGTAYNLGLSKESLFGFLPISICFTSMGGWAWLLSHGTLGELGWLYLAFVFFTILFQISWSGHLKEMAQEERSNILVKMGARLETHFIAKEIRKHFFPGRARWYGLAVKAVNVALAWVILYKNYRIFSLHTTTLFSVIAMVFLRRLTVPRMYERARELKNMSLMEISTIYMPLPLFLNPPAAVVLMLIGIVYFFLVNKLLWAVPYPKV